MGGNGCGPGDQCSSTDATAGTCDPILAVPDGGTVALVGGGFCSIGWRGARRGAHGGGGGGTGGGAGLAGLAAVALGALALRRRGRARI